MGEGHKLLTYLLDPAMQEDLKATFFVDYERGLLRTNIRERDISELSATMKYNLFYVCFMKSISVIPTIEMTRWITSNFSPDYDICGGAGNLGFCLNIPTSDSYFRLNNKEFDKRVEILDGIHGDILRPDFSLCTNTERLTGNQVAKLPNVNTVVGSWILVQNPNKLINEAMRVQDVLLKHPEHVSKINPSPKLKKVMRHLNKTGKVGVPNGVNLGGLLKDANLVFIGNHLIHHKRLVRELYSMHKHKTYSQDQLPFIIIDKPYLRGEHGHGFIKYFRKKG